MKDTSQWISVEDGYPDIGKWVLIRRYTMRDWRLWTIHEAMIVCELLDDGEWDFWTWYEEHVHADA